MIIENKRKENCKGINIKIPNHYPSIVDEKIDYKVIEKDFITDNKEKICNLFNKLLERFIGNKELDTVLSKILNDDDLLNRCVYTKHCSYDTVSLYIRPLIETEIEIDTLSGYNKIYKMWIQQNPDKDIYDFIKLNDLKIFICMISTTKKETECSKQCLTRDINGFFHYDYYLESLMFGGTKNRYDPEESDKKYIMYLQKEMEIDN